MTRSHTKRNPYSLETDLVTTCHESIVELRDIWGQPVHGERLNQRRADLAGSDRGSPDYLLCAGGRQLPLEFKRAEGGRFSLDQLVAAERRRKAGVETYAPTSTAHFDALVRWALRRREGVCPDCPVVPEL